jgi:hypothetical protein
MQFSLRSSNRFGRHGDQTGINFSRNLQTRALRSPRQRRCCRCVAAGEPSRLSRRTKRIATRRPVRSPGAREAVSASGTRLACSRVRISVGARRSPKRATAVAVSDNPVAFPLLLAPEPEDRSLLLREDHIRRPQPTTRGRTRDPGSGGWLTSSSESRCGGRRTSSRRYLRYPSSR